MKPGDIVLTAISQADGTSKQRPVLLLCQLPGFGDWLVCGISTQLRQTVAGFDEAVQASDADYAASGLKAPSLIRLSFLAVVPMAGITRCIGAIDRPRLHRLLTRLSGQLRPPSD